VYTFKKWSKAQADRYFDLLVNEIKYLAANQNAGRSAGIASRDYRVSAVKSHLIFYKVKSDNMVEIVRILHQRMDTKKRLG
jgi:toxin ParE1/3/4